jgi:hypothetical protein
MTRQSTVVVDYTELRQPPLDDNHAVRLADLRAAQYNYLYNGVPLPVLFPGINVDQALDHTAFYVLPSGQPATAHNTDDASTGVVGIRVGSYCHLNNTIIKGWSTGMTPGTEYFLTSSGTLGAAPTEDGRWNIRLAIALNSTDIITSFHISGKS